MSNWLREAVLDGLTNTDTDILLHEAADHCLVEGTWSKGRIRPSLVAVECRLQRVKRFLDHAPIPGVKSQMNLRGARPDAGTNLNFLRGFLMEGVLVAALKHSIGDYVAGNAPSLLFACHAADAEWEAHPDVMVRTAGTAAEPEALELVQIKCPSVFAFDRYDKGDQRMVIERYLPQMACEMFIGREMGLPIVRNWLLMATWESTPRINAGKPRLLTASLDWSESLAGMMTEIAGEIKEDALQALALNRWPDAVPASSWDSFPCSYCSFNRVGQETTEHGRIPACDDHGAWLEPSRQAALDARKVALLGDGAAR